MSIHDPQLRLTTLRGGPLDGHVLLLPADADTFEKKIGRRRHRWWRLKLKGGDRLLHESKIAEALGGRRGGAA